MTRIVDPVEIATLVADLVSLAQELALAGYSQGRHVVTRVENLAAEAREVGDECLLRVLVTTSSARLDRASGTTTYLVPPTGYLADVGQLEYELFRSDSESFRAEEDGEAQSSHVTPISEIVEWFRTGAL
jgi:hypothetical protein